MIISIVIILILIYLSLNREKLKGKIGENRVNKIIESIPNSKMLKDVMLKTESGTSQIDHILINSKGIFVIETKNYSGWIFGDERAKYWTQIIYKKKSKFYNPIRQNYGHIKAIEACILPKKDIFHSIIVFNDRCEFKDLKVKSKVIKVNQLKRALNGYKSDVVLTNADINYFYMLLEKNNITNENDRKMHVKGIKEKHKF